MQQNQNYFIDRVYTDDGKINPIDHMRWYLMAKEQIACLLQTTPKSSEFISLSTFSDDIDEYN